MVLAIVAGIFIGQAKKPADTGEATTAIVGSLLCVAYAATKTKAGSLTKE